LNRRILIVDDQLSLHEDYAKALAPRTPAAHALTSAKAAFFGETAAPAPVEEGFELVFASQGQEALALLQAAQKEKRPFAMAFVDMRMPPGWDGVETIERLWIADADLEVVICTAYADYSLEEITTRLKRSSQLLVLKKPFDLVEVQQLANALCSKWDLVQTERAQLEAVRQAEAKARAYAASLTTINTALTQAKAGAESNLQAKNELLEEIAEQVRASAEDLLHTLERARDGAVRSDASTWIEECAGLGEELQLIALLSQHATGSLFRAHEDCALPTLLDSLHAIAHGPIPSRIHADPLLLRQTLELLCRCGGALELEYLEGNSTLRWRWKGDACALSATRLQLLERLCRVQSIEREVLPGVIELVQSLGHVDPALLTLHPQSPLPSGSANRSETVRLAE
jgi:CheY-like chemotaxis protein